MAELNNESSGEGSRSKKIRSKKLGSRVDLTAMVDLAFLLITFFMLTTSLSKPHAMTLSMPDCKGEPMPVDENRTMTILIGEHNKAKCYMGRFSGTQKDIVLRTLALRKELIIRKREALAYSEAKGKSGQGLIVIIKPGKQSDYGNLVDVLDELAISNVSTYAIAEIEPDEAQVLQQSPKFP